MDVLLSLLCCIFLAIHCALGITFVIRSVEELQENRERAQRDADRELREKEYHRARMDTFK